MSTFKTQLDLDHPGQTWDSLFTSHRFPHGFKIDGNRESGIADPMLAVTQFNKITADQGEVILAFCGKTRPPDIEQYINSSTTHFRNSWLYQETNHHLGPRADWLSTSELYNLLRLRRSGVFFPECAKRRLIFIHALTPLDAVVLLGSYFGFEAGGLRTGMSKYLLGEASIEPMGFKTFRLSMHISYLMLEDTDDKSQPENSSNEYPIRIHQNISYLFPKPSATAKTTLRQVVFSTVIVGVDDRTWTGYGFADHDDSRDHMLELELHANETRSEESDCDSDEQILNRPGVDENPFFVLPISNTAEIACPRRYFLEVLRSQMLHVEKQWNATAHRIHRSINVYKRDHPLSLRNWHSTGARESVDWATRTASILDTTFDSLAACLMSWERFCSSGNLNLFLELADMGYTKLVHDIEQSFASIQRYRDEIGLQREAVNGYLNGLERLLTIQSKNSWGQYLPRLGSLTVGNFPRFRINPLYSPLSFRNSEVRLLRFSQPFTGAALSAVLTTVPLPRAPQYTALSYHWGEHKTTVEIRLNNFAVPITTNLYDALCRLRAERTEYVWADALCINQEDHEERSTQVSRMGAIFQKADKVVIWIGPEPSNLDSGFKVQDGTNFVLLDCQPEVLNEKTVHHLLQRPYWSRGWVIQEVSLASRAMIYFGRCCISWEEFVNCVQRGRFNTDCDRESLVDQLSGFETVLHFRQLRTMSTPVPFVEAIRRTCKSRTTDPRDKLYAILGLSYDGKHLIPETNYITPTEEVFKEFTIALLKSQCVFDYIYLRNGSPSRNTSGPSWVPNWEQLDDVISRRQFSFIVNISQKPHLGRKSFIEILGPVLKVNGMTVDTICNLGSVFTRRSGDLEGSDDSENMILPEPDFSCDMAESIFKTFTGIGLLSNRRWLDSDDHHLKQISLHASDAWPALDAQKLRGDLGDERKGAELELQINAWLAANHRIVIGGRDLNGWWELFKLSAAFLGDSYRITRHFHDAIGCNMRFAVTTRGKLGWAHPQTQYGDKIAMVSGCRSYVVLRPIQNRYNVVGDVIVPGLDVGDKGYEAYRLRELQLI